MDLVELNPALDQRNMDILSTRISAWNQNEGQRVGDFVRMLDGSTRRFTHDWGDDIQTTVGKSHPNDGDCRIYLGNGYTEFSGSLDRAILKTSLLLTPEVLPGSFWFFRNHDIRAHNGVNVKAPCRVYRQMVPASA